MGPTMAKNMHDKGGQNQPVIQNRKARYSYAITDTLECGIKLTGTETKSVRAGQVSLAEGYVRAEDAPISLVLHSVHIAEYPPAGPARQHQPDRARILLAHKREIRKLAVAARAKGFAIVPLKMYFVNGRAKVLIGMGQGKKQRDRRQDIRERDARLDMERAMKR